MGLKTNNYQSKSLGVLLPSAYAKLTMLNVYSDDTVRAIFTIQQTREAIEKLSAVDKVEITFVWDRVTDVAKMAYEIARNEIKTISITNDDGTEAEIKVPGTLYGWQNDIIKEV